MLSGLKSVHMGIHVNSEDYGISHTCYPYTPILIPLLQTSYLLHNSMSLELFGEALERRKKKQEEKRKLEGISVNKLYIIYLFR